MCVCMCVSSTYKKYVSYAYIKVRLLSLYRCYIHVCVRVCVWSVYTVYNNRLPPRTPHLGNSVIAHTLERTVG